MRPGAVGNHLLFVLALLMGVSAKAADPIAPSPSPSPSPSPVLTGPEQAAKEIWAKLNAGVVPTLADQPVYYTGRCIGLGDTVNPDGIHYGIVGLQKVGDDIKTTWKITYDVTDNPYLAQTREQILKAYPVDRVARVEGGHLFTDISAEPRVFYQIAADATQSAKRIYVGGIQTGPAYCDLLIMRFSSK